MVLICHTKSRLEYGWCGSLEYTKVVTDEELLRIVERGRSEGQFLQEEEEMIKSVLEFSDTTVREIMTPRLAVSGWTRMWVLTKHFN